MWLLWCLQAPPLDSQGRVLSICDHVNFSEHPAIMETYIPGMEEAMCVMALAEGKYLYCTENYFIVWNGCGTMTVWKSSKIKNFREIYQYCLLKWRYTFFNTFLAVDSMKLSASWCHFWQCPLEIGSAWAERAGQGDVGGCTWTVPTAWPSLGSALKHLSWHWVGHFFPPTHKQAEKTVLSAYWTPIPSSETSFLSGQVIASWKSSLLQAH